MFGDSGFTDLCQRNTTARSPGRAARSWQPRAPQASFANPLPAFRVINTAANPIAAANASHNPGTARFPVLWISHVQTAGVKPPKTAVARLKAIENPDARTFAGIISVRNGTIAPL